jgi:hypothetical protein
MITEVHEDVKVIVGLRCLAHCIAGDLAFSVNSFSDHTGLQKVELLWQVSRMRDSAHQEVWSVGDDAVTVSGAIVHRGGWLSLLTLWTHPHVDAGMRLQGGQPSVALTALPA